MALKEVNWEDYPSTSTPVNAANLKVSYENESENAANITALNSNLSTLQTTVSNLSTTVSDNYTTLTDHISSCNAELADLKKSVSDGKTTVASAITNAGVSTAADATFATMAANIATVAAQKYASGKTDGAGTNKPTSATLSNSGNMAAYNSSGTAVYSNTFANSYDTGYDKGYEDGYPSSFTTILDGKYYKTVSFTATIGKLYSVLISYPVNYTPTISGATIVSATGGNQTSGSYLKKMYIIKATSTTVTLDCGYNDTTYGGSEMLAVEIG